MELSFEIPAWLESFLSEPVYVVLWAVFGVAFTVALLSFVPARIDKILKVNYLVRLFTPGITALAITWISGFPAMAILLFSGISAVRMFLIWCIVFVGFLIFSIVERKAISKFYNKG